MDSAKTLALDTGQQKSLRAKAYGRILTGLLVVLAMLAFGLVVEWATAPERLFPDFFGLWSFGRYVLVNAPATIYDNRALQTFQIALGMPNGSFYPFPYPPWILLLLAPFGVLDYATARCLWLGLTFAANGVALAAWRWPRSIMGLLLVAPSSAICLSVGQNGFVTAALMLGGIRLLRRRPFIAGAMLASVAYKPQLAILVPFVLVFGRHWRAMAGAALSVTLLSMAATLAFGPQIWAAWLDYMRDHAPNLALGREQLDMMPTVTSAVLLIGGSALLAHVAQAIGTVAGLLAIWRVRALDTPESHAVLPLATILATPYAFAYDLPIVTGAVLAVVAARFAAGARFGPIEFPILLACITVPIILPARLGAESVIVPAVLALTLGMLCRVGSMRPGERMEPL